MSGEQQFDQMIWAIINYKKSKKKKNCENWKERKERKKRRTGAEQDPTKRCSLCSWNRKRSSSLSGKSFRVVPATSSCPTTTKPKGAVSAPAERTVLSSCPWFYRDVWCGHTGFQRRSRDSRAGGREVSRRLCPNQPVDGAASRPLSLASPSSFLQRGRKGLWFIKNINSAWWTIIIKEIDYWAP